MTFSELFVLASVVGLGGWAAYKIPHSTRRDREWRDAVRALARRRNLAEERAETGPGVHDLDTTITWKWITETFCRNPACGSPPAGSPLFVGANNGFRFIIDSVRVRKSWTSLEDEHLRLAVELPGLPATLRIRPAGPVRRLARVAGLAPRPRGRRNTLAAAFSSDSGDRLEQERFLTAQRHAVLEDLEDAAGKAHVYTAGGMLFLIRRRKGASPEELDALYEHLGAFAERLAGGAGHPSAR